MSTPALFNDFTQLHHRWGWFLALGILLVVLGIVALVYTPAATLASVLVLGWLMFFSGIVEAVHAFHARGWGGVLLHVAGGALGILIGLLVVTHPIAGALAWTATAAFALGRPRGTGLEAVSAEGGGSPAAAALLATAVLYAAFWLRLRRASGGGPTPPWKWVLFAVVNLIGSAAIVGLFTGGAADPDVLLAGLAMQIVLVPLVGVAAYRDLYDHFDDWRERRAQAPAAVSADTELATDEVLLPEDAPELTVAVEEPQEVEEPPPPPPPE